MIGQALRNLAPAGEWSITYNTDNEVVVWLSDDITQPTEAEIDAEVTRLQAEYDSLEYARLRQIEYAKRNQDEMRYDDAKNGTNLWVEWIDEIKLAIPKGSV